MQPLPEEMLVPMVGVMVGLVIFSGLLLLGVRVVRWLKLPNDLPEGPHFEPPPPPIRDVLDRAEAARIAAEQSGLRQRFAFARSAVQAAQLCAELATQDYAVAKGAPDPSTVKPELTRLAAAAKISAEAADQAARNPKEIALGECEALANSAMAAAKEAEVLAAKFPSVRERRLRIMVVILVIVVICSILIFTFQPHT